MIKRVFDCVVAIAGLAVLSPFLLLVAILIKLDSPGPALFRQERIGKRFRPFLIYKFRTMVHDRSRPEGLITVKGDPRITRIGKFLRVTKLDELPQLINVLRGQMSLVGPRPEVRQYVEFYKTEYEEILTMRPGITDLASLKYRDEERILRESENPQQAYLERILPDKIRLAKEYINKASFCFDLALILKTLSRLISDKVLEALRKRRSPIKLHS